MRARRQLSLEDISPPLQEAELVVVDLETTGTDPQHDAITEIGAVKVRGGEMLGEFRTFVDPQRPIPAYIASLTGISDATVQGAPAISVVLPGFLEFVGSAALVAHNARFDIGFLTAAAAKCDVEWPRPTVLDTLALARRVFRRDEVRDHRLSTLASYVGAHVTPDHRALSDARATVDVLHAIIERLGPAAATLEDLASAHRRATAVQMRKRYLADGVPSAPGVYQFLADDGEVLYVGTSRNLRSRVRTYFTAAETRRRVLDMLPRAQSVQCIECATPTEAAVRELRIIAREKPPSNRAGLSPEKALWLRLGTGSEGLRAARLARDETDGSAHIGPLASRHDVEPLRGLLTDALLGRGAAWERAAVHGRSFPSSHRDALHAVMTSDPTPVLQHAARRMRAHAGAGRYEDAERIRQLAVVYLTAARRAARLRTLGSVPLLIAARPSKDPVADGRGWELLAVRHGRFTATTLLPWHADHLAAARTLAAQRTEGDDEPRPLCQGHHQETEILLRWLDSEDVRVVQVEGTWSQPLLSRFDESALHEAFTATAHATTSFDVTGPGAEPA